jgi:hypothetical protein
MKILIKALAILALCSVGVAQVSSSARTAMKTANIVSGPAPLSVVFDAVGIDTKVVQPKNFNDASYKWGFGDSNAGTFAVNGKSKNSAFGYVAAHVYEVPGTYTASLQLVTSDGALRNYTQIITVTDPDVVYAGQTYYIADSGNDATGNGSLANPWKTPSRGFSVLWNDSVPRRILFKRGDVFATSPLQAPMGGRVGPFHVGAYGTGSKPIIRLTTTSGSGDYSILNLSYWHQSTGLAVIDGLRIVDVDFDRVDDRGQGIIIGKNTLLLNSLVTNCGTGLTCSDPICKNNVVAKCEFLSQGVYAIYYSVGYGNIGSPDHFALLDTKVNPPTNNSLVRTYAGRMVWQGNNFIGFANQSPTRIMGMSDEHPTKYVCVTDNVFQVQAAWVLEIGPENNQNGDGVHPQIVDTLLLEGNIFRRAPGGDYFQTFAMLWGHNIEVRNNIFDCSNTIGGNVIEVNTRGIGPNPRGVRVRNNTGFRSTSTTEAWNFVGVGVVGEPVIVGNNLVYAPASTVRIATGNATTFNNLTGYDAFVDEANGDFHLFSGTNSAVNTGANAPIRYDFDRNPRPFTPLWDIGAFERQQ